MYMRQKVERPDVFRFRPHGVCLPRSSQIRVDLCAYFVFLVFVRTNSMSRGDQRDRDREVRWTQQNI